MARWLASTSLRALVALLVGCTVVVIAAQGFMSAQLTPLATVVLGPVVILVNLVPAPNIGSAERPVYEGTPVHVLAAIVGYLATGVIYVFGAYCVLTAYSRRHPRAG